MEKTHEMPKSKSKFRCRTFPCNASEASTRTGCIAAESFIRPVRSRHRSLRQISLLMKLVCICLHGMFTRSCFKCTSLRC